MKRYRTQYQRADRKAYFTFLKVLKDLFCCSFVCPVFALVYFAAPLGSHAYEYRAQGVLLDTSYSQKGESTLGRLYFDFAATNIFWRLRIVNALAHDGEKKGSSVRELSSDGVDLYIVYNYTNRSLRSFPQYGNVSETIYPHDAAPLERVLWLAFASSKFFDGVQTGRILNLLDTGPQATNTHHFQVESFGKPLTLPKRMEIYQGEIRIFKDGRERVIQFPKPYDTGYMCMLYSVAKTKNLNELQIPVSAALETFIPQPLFEQTPDPVTGRRKPIDSTIAPRLRRRISIEVTNLIAASGIEGGYAPKLGSSSYIRDGRFTNQIRKVLNYPTTNGQWISRADTNLPARLKKAAEQKLHSPPAPQKLKLWLVVILGVVAFTPIAIIISRKFRPRKSDK